MSVLTPTKKDEKQSKVHYSQYIRSEDKAGDDGTKPSEPVKPAQPEAK